MKFLLPIPERLVVVRVTKPNRECMASTQSYHASQPVDVVLVPRDTTHATRFVERVRWLDDCGWLYRGVPPTTTWFETAR